MLYVCTSSPGEAHLPHILPLKGALSPWRGGKMHPSLQAIVWSAPKEGCIPALEMYGRMVTGTPTGGREGWKHLETVWTCSFEDAISCKVWMCPSTSASTSRLCWHHLASALREVVALQKSASNAFKVYREPAVWESFFVGGPRSQKYVQCRCTAQLVAGVARVPGVCQHTKVRAAPGCLQQLQNWACRGKLAFPPFPGFLRSADGTFR